MTQKNLENEFEGIERSYLQMPHVEKGMSVGIFGGSFNPPHQGHVLVSEIALRRLQLDQLWWMVTPANPLKNRQDLAPLKQRLSASEAIKPSPRVKVTALEAGINTRFSEETLVKICERNRGVQFVWIMGADNLKYFHYWQNWQNIARLLPIAVIDRPGSTLSYLSSKMAQRFDFARVDEADSLALSHRKAPAWTFIHGPRNGLSSTQLRQKRTGEIEQQSA